MLRNLYHIAILFSILSCSTSLQEKNTLMTEPGVSKNLADYRKENIENLNYALHFIIPDSVNFPIEASETITLELKKNEQPLQADFKEKTEKIKKITVNGLEIEIDHQEEHIIIPTDALREGTNTIEIGFTAGDLSLNRNEDYLYTLLVPDRTRTVFPVFDQPDLKATFDLTLTVPEGWQALSNGPLMNSVANEGQIRYEFGRSDKISTYLFSFAAGKFTKVSRTVGGVDMNFYHRETDEEKIRESLDPIFRIHADALEFMEEYTGIPYPFQKFDFIAIPGFQYGGMEHTGAIDYRASTLFLDEGATKNQKISRSSLIAHETAHMWFGNLVTMRWFDDVWMKEVFANFMADKVTQFALEGTNYDLKFLTGHFPAAYSVDRTAGANPIRQNLDNLQDAGSLYGNIIYHKSPIMMRQLERLMGEEAFRDGLREYLKMYANDNATWPQLIEILDKRTAIDLNKWNQVWVNEPGRPEFDYSLASEDGKITALTLIQHDPGGKGRIWPQIIELLLVYPEHTEQLTITINDEETQVREALNKAEPQFILFNSTGQGYGVFPVDTSMLRHQDRLFSLKDPVERVSAYITLYENMLNGRSITPTELLDLLIAGLTREKEELNLGLITNYISAIYWKFIPEDQRNSAILENQLWSAMQQNPSANEKKVLFQAYQNIMLTKEALDTVYAIWKEQRPPEGVKLSEDDYTSMALALAVRDYREGILEEQLTRISNSDRKERLEFIMPALSSDEQERDTFFASLKDPKNREKESWVASALSYLHHPLRTATSEKYLKESLELLEEIQLTGDIFFPYSWLKSTFSAYRSERAAEVVNEFLEQHPDYNPKLRDKILQATDDLFRTNELLRK